MSRHTEAAGNLRFLIDTAPGQVEHLSTVIALEVVVMAFAGDLVAGRFSRNFDWRKPLFSNQSIQVSVNSGDADPFDLLLSKSQEFFWRQRTVGVEQCRSYGLFLPGVAYLNQ